MEVSIFIYKNDYNNINNKIEDIHNFIKI